MEASEIRRTPREVHPPDNYYVAGLVGADPEEIWRTKIAVLRDQAMQLGFDNLFDAVLVDAQYDVDSLGYFIDSGGLGKLYSAYKQPRKRSGGASEELRTTSACVPAMDIYRREWSALHAETAMFKQPLNSFSDEYVNEFSFDQLFDQMKAISPRLMDLMIALTTKAGNESIEGDPESKTIRAQKRHIVVALSVLANHASQRFNAVQGRIGYLCIAGKVSKRMIAILNKIGITPSYKALIEAVKANAKSALFKLSRLGRRNEAMWISYDNLTYTANVRDLRLFNRSDFIILTCGYAVVPHPSVARPMFSQTDCDYGALRSLRITDFLPTPQGYETTRKGAESAIWDIFKQFASHKGSGYPDLDFPQPEVYRLDPTKRSEIMPLPTFNLNEGIISEVIQIIEQVSKVIGLSDKQKEECLIPFKGDQATSRQNR